MTPPLRLTFCTLDARRGPNCVPVHLHVLGWLPVPFCVYLKWHPLLKCLFYFSHSFYKWLDDTRDILYHLKQEARRDVSPQIKICRYVEECVG